MRGLIVFLTQEKLSPKLFRSRSAVDQLTVNQPVAGSIPASEAN